MTLNKQSVTRVYTNAIHNIEDIEHIGSLSSICNNHTLYLFKIGVLCNSAHLNPERHIGSPTEIAILEFAAKIGLEDTRFKHQKVSEIPFSSDFKFMAVNLVLENESVWYVKGAVDAILSKCTRVYISDSESRVLDIESKERLHVVSRSIESDGGLRVICFAYGKSLEALTFVGFIGMSDPLRKGVAEGVRRLMSAGVKVVMITGDSGIFHVT